MREVPKAITRRLESIQEMLDPERNDRASDAIKRTLRGEASQPEDGRAFKLWFESWVRPDLNDVVAWSEGKVDAADLAHRDRHRF